jgi:Co/Zn/Cd efflux system component
MHTATVSIGGRDSMAANADCGCGAKDAAQASPAYKRALWIVAGLNAGMALIGGAVAVLGHAVSVQADALDFLGDAVATAIGLVLVGCAARTRSKTAVVQGLALGALGLLTLGVAAMRAVSAAAPMAQSMGVYGVAGLAVNVACAMLLLRYQGRDASARAVFLFSRNDAIGNVAVLIAAGLVALSSSRWPDVIVAAVLAVLFLHSSVSIVREARHELEGVP